LRVAGKGAAALTLLCDLLKGIPLLMLAQQAGLEEPALLLIAFAAIMGHIFPVFLRFKGGKGVATSFGVILVLAPKVAFVGLLLWGIGAFLGKHSSVGALSAFASLPFLTFIFKGTPIFVIFSIFVSALVYFRHWGNISRLLQGTEL